MSSLASCDKMHGAIICFLSKRASWLLSWHFEALEIIWGVCWDRLRGPTTEGMDKITFSIAVAFSGVVDDDVSNFGIFEIVWCARWPHGRGHGHNCCLVSFQRSLLPHCLEKGLLESEKAGHLAFSTSVLFSFSTVWLGMLREERDCRQLNDIVGVRAVAGAESWGAFLFWRWLENF